MNKVTSSTNETSAFAPSKSSKKWIWILMLLVFLTGAGFMYFSKAAKSSKEHKNANAVKPIPVITAVAKTDEIRVYLSGLGTVTPLATVIVKSRVDGEIIKIHFKEGQMVKRGDLLVEVDPRPYEAALMQAQGQLMRDQALLTDARLNLARYQTLLKQDSIASQQVDTQQALVRQYQGSVKIDEGLLATAKLNLVYTKIKAPVSGRIGLRQIDVGNIARASDVNGLAIITQLQPMSVLFSLPEDDIPKLMKKMNSGKKITVNAFDRAYQEKITSGFLQTIDNQIDPTTGMVRLRAEFTNEDLSLFPSQFVNAQVLLENKLNVVTIPNSAIQYGKTNSYTFVVGPDHKVDQRDIVVGTVQGNNTEVISGLASNEMVVIDGADKLRAGTAVEIPANKANFLSVTPMKKP
jgi:multidrug efflux system membrane fusion protein